MASQAARRCRRRPAAELRVGCRHTRQRRPAGVRGGGVCGSTRHAPAERSPYRAPKPASGPRPRQRGHHPGARARRARGRGSSPARAGDAVGPHEVPGRRPAGARGARPHQGRRDEHRGAPHRAAQAARRGRDDPGEDRRPRHLAPRAARRGRRGLRRGQEAQAGDARGRRCRGGPGGGRRHRARGRRRRASAGWCRSRSSRASWPTRSSPPTSAPPRRARLADIGWPAGSCSARCSGRSSTPPAERRPAWPCPSPSSLRAPGGLELMPHQAQVVAAAAAGHRTFLLADEPGLGKTAQALLAAQAANAYPLLVVVPNVVKTNWAREVGPLDAQARCHRDPRRRRHDRRLRRHRHRQLRGARPARRLARRPRLPRHGRRRGALHQEQGVPALAARAAALRADPGPDRAAAADGADRHAR